MNCVGQRETLEKFQACGVEHFIYSSLNHLSVLSKGKYVNVVHEDAKALVAQYAQAQLKAVTLLIPREFAFSGALEAVIAAVRRNILTKIRAGGASSRFL